MSRTVRMEPVSLKQDARGWVFEPMAAGELAAQRNVHVVLTEPGCVRGNHYHQRGTEVLTAVGPALLRFREDGRTWEVRVPEGEVQRFWIPAGVSHAIQNSGDRPTLLVAFNTEAHDTNSPDVVRDVLIEV